MHGVKMKIVVIRGKADGLAEGPPTIEPPNEAWKKKLNFFGDCSIHVMLTMYGLTKNGREDVTTIPKDINVSSIAQVNVITQPSNEVLKVASLQVISPKNRKGKSFKYVNLSQVSMHVSKIVYVI